MSRDYIPHEEVLRYIYEYLDYFGYRDSLIALQAESCVPYNTIHVPIEVHDEKSKSLNANASLSYRTSNTPAREGKHRVKFPPPSLPELEQAVMHGRWSEVLNVYVDGLLVPYEVRAGLYELIFEEILHIHGIQTAARTLLQHSPIFEEMKETAPARLARLQKMLDEFDPLEWEDRKKKMGGGLAGMPEIQKRREGVLHQLKDLIHFSSDPFDGALPSALLIAERCTCQAGGMGVRRADSRNEPRPAKRERCAASDATFDVLNTRSSSALQKPWSEVRLEYTISVPQSLFRKIPYPIEKALTSCSVVLMKKEKVEPIALLGRADGMLEFMALQTGDVVGSTTTHTEGVLSLALDVALVPAEAFQKERTPAPPSDKTETTPPVCTKNSSHVWVAVGYRDGSVKVYNCTTYRLVRRFQCVHLMGVTSLIFAGSRNANLVEHRKFVITGSYDTTMHVLDIVKGSSVFKVSDPHHGSFINALCPLPCGHQLCDKEAVRTVMSAGNDCAIGFWVLDEEAGLMRSLGGRSWNLMSFYHNCKGVTATALQLVSTQAGDEANTKGFSPSETDRVIVTTRSNIVLIVSIKLVHDKPEHPIEFGTLCVVQAQKRIRHVSSCVCWSVSLPVPVLCMYATDESGTILLYNIEMKWLDAEAWHCFNGALNITSATDEGTVVVSDIGKTLDDLCVCGVWHPASDPMILAYSPSVSNLYVLR